MAAEVCKGCVLIARLTTADSTLTLKYFKVGEDNIIYYVEDLQVEISASAHALIYQSTWNKTLGSVDEGEKYIAQSTHMELEPDHGEIRIAIMDQSNNVSTLFKLCDDKFVEVHDENKET